MWTCVACARGRLWACVAAVASGEALELESQASLPTVSREPRVLGPLFQRPWRASVSNL